MHEHMHELCQCAARWSLYLQEPVALSTPGSDSFSTLAFDWLSFVATALQVHISRTVRTQSERAGRCTACMKWSDIIFDREFGDTARSVSGSFRS